MNVLKKHLLQVQVYENTQIDRIGRSAVIKVIYTVRLWENVLFVHKDARVENRSVLYELFSIEIFENLRAHVWCIYSFVRNCYEQKCSGNDRGG